MLMGFLMVHKKGTTNQSHDELIKLLQDVWRASEGDTMKTMENLVDFLVTEASHGVDLSRNYPQAFELLMANEEARQTFIELIESQADKKKYRLPIGEPSLAFLRHREKQQLEEDPRGGWQIRFHRSDQQLKQLFVPPTFAYRSREPNFDRAWIPLLREHAQLDDSISLAISLEAAWTSKPDEVSLYLSLAALKDDNVEPNLSYEVDLKWGTYREHVETGDIFRLALAPLPVSAGGLERHLSQTLELNLAALAK